MRTPDIATLTGLTAEQAKPAVIAARIQAMFMEVMIKAMEDSTGPEGGLFGSGASSEIYSGLFREHLGLAMSSALQTPLEQELASRLSIRSADGLPVDSGSAPLSLKSGWPFSDRKE